MKLRRSQPTSGRNRPRTDRSAGRSVYSYYNTFTGTQQQSVKPEKSIDLRPASRVRMIPTLIASAVILGSLLFSLTLSTVPAVTYVSEGMTSPYRDKEEYGKKAQELLEAQLRNRVKVSIDTNMIEQELLRTYPEIAAVRVRLPVLGRKPTIVLDIHEPAMILATNTRSFILDEGGTAIAEMRELSSEARQGLLVLQDQSGLVTERGKQAVTSGTVRFILALKAQFDAQDLSIEQLTLPTVANELDVRLSGASYYIKTDTSGDARLQAGSYLAVKEHLAGQGITPAEYIDVRVEEKVFYK